MKGLNKLVLASAIIAASSSAFAMQALDEDTMSATTGQDGLTITINSTNLQNLDVKYIDRDGIAGDATYAHAGGLHIFGAGGATDGLDITSSDPTVITLDVGGVAGSGAGAGGQLRIGVAMGATTINLQNVTIAAVDAVDTANLTATNHATTGPDAGNSIISFGTGAALNIAAGSKIEIQLGNRAVGSHFLTTFANLGNISLTNLSINDSVGGGSISLGTVGLSGVQSSAAVDVVAGGLRIDTGYDSTAAGGYNGTSIGQLALERVKLGSAAQAPIGDVYISNLTANNVITITGH